MIGTAGLTIILESQIQEHPIFSENRKLDCEVYTRNQLISFLNVLNLVIRLIGSENSNEYAVTLANHPDVLRVLVGIAGEKWKNSSPIGTLNSHHVTPDEDIQKFERCIIKKTKYLLFMLWYVRSARKVYQKQGYLKRDFVWYTRDGKEQPLSGNEVTANETTEKLKTTAPEHCCPPKEIVEQFEALH